MAAFAELGVHPDIIRSVNELDWSLPTDIQAESIPLILGGGDVLAAAETGSGKTGAFALPVAQIVWESLRQSVSSSSSSSNGADVREDTLAMSAIDRDAQFATDGVVCQCRDPKEWQGGRANKGVLHGSYYFETTMTDDGLCRVGFATANARLNLGTCPFGFGYGGTAKKSNSGKFENYGEKFGNGDVIGCYIDRSRGVIGFTKNGTDLGVAHHIPQKLKKMALFPAVVVKNAELTVNFGSSPFRFHLDANTFLPLTHGSANLEANLNGLSISGPAAEGRSPLALILEPVRELAQQTHDACITFCKYLPNPVPECTLLIGGADSKRQSESLRKGTDIVTATPGRLEAMVNSNALKLDRVRFFVLDEADRLNADNRTTLLKIQGMLPKNGLQVLLFSATLHTPGVQKLADKICRFPTWVDLKGKDAIPETVDHVFVNVDARHDTAWKNAPSKIKTDGVHTERPHVNSRDGLSEATKILKGDILLRLLQQNSIEQAMIFVRTKLDADNLESFLQRFSTRGNAMVDCSPFSCCVLHGSRNVAERQRNLQRFKDGEVKLLICTDVAARGIDIDALPYVINYTLPDEVEK